MQRNMYARIEHITDVMGRIDYISSPDRQENLYAIYGISLQLSAAAASEKAARKEDA